MRTSQFNSATASQMPMRILVAEDNRVNQRLILLMLQHLGYRADLAKNGREAVTAVRDNDYDVVLMDIDMPEMDGMEATSRVRVELSPCEQPQIVAVTANVCVGHRERCIRAGMNDYVSKPISAKSLLCVLEGCFARLDRCAALD